jgi:hypothetical protein
MRLEGLGKLRKQKSPHPGLELLETGGWVDLRAGLDDLENRTFLTLPGLELRPLFSRARS